MLMLGCGDDSALLASEGEDILLGRSTSISCDNLLENGDFEEHPVIFDCVSHEFASGLVPPWVDFGTSDLITEEGVPVGCPQFMCHRYDHAHSTSTVNVPHTSTHYEGLLQEVEIVSDPDIYYSLRFEAVHPWINPSGMLGAYFLDGSPLFDEAGPLDFSNGYTITEVPVTGVPGRCNGGEWPEFFTNYIFPDRDYNNFFILLQGEDSINAAVLYDNIELLCHSTLLEGIKVDQTGECTYAFTPVFSGDLDVLQYEWDFGDGMTSTSEVATHTYQREGLYTVTLTIKDANGCCTTVSTVVSCLPEGSTACTTHACWTDVGHPLVGGSGCIVGMTIQWPDCSLQDIFFQEIPNAQECNDGISPAIIPAKVPVSEHYCEIKQQIITELNNLGLNFVILEENDMIEECLKGNDPIPGYFITLQNARFHALIAQECTLGQTEYNLFTDFPDSQETNCLGCESKN